MFFGCYLFDGTTQPSLFSLSLLRRLVIVFLHLRIFSFGFVLMLIVGMWTRPNSGKLMIILLKIAGHIHRKRHHNSKTFLSPHTVPWGEISARHQHGIRKELAQVQYHHPRPYRCQNLFVNKRQRRQGNTSALVIVAGGDSADEIICEPNNNARPNGDQGCK